MNVARINFSHGDHDSHLTTIKTLCQVAAEEAAILAILGDLQGPKRRLGYVRAGGIQLAVNDQIGLTPHHGQPSMIHLPHPDLLAKLQIGAKLIIGDGEVEMAVVDKQADTVRCQVTVPGLLESRN
jgi:pyruvate kinase